MQNLEQIRASAALDAAIDTSKQAVSKLPAMIMTNGLLAAIAFADERNSQGEPKRRAMKNAVDATANHLANPIHGISALSSILQETQNKGTSALTKLSEGTTDSLDLQRATSEALSFLSYLKRFTTNEEAEN